MPTPLSWLEVDGRALACNLRKFRARLDAHTRLMAVVKADAYGHGMAPVARVALGAGADWLGVFNLAEALALRAAGLQAPILVLGYVPLADLGEAAAQGVRVTASSLETLEAGAAAARAAGQPLHLHLKLETGTQRLGLDGEPLARALALLREHPELHLEGAHTHFANIEDTTEHDFARGQLGRFQALLAEVRAAGFPVELPHTACT
ncbi:MAG TPA: alanine racemase, partial [Myxococcota bacterium]|nr:alanine racemase [Myxococcota bacterium]